MTADKSRPAHGRQPLELGRSTMPMQVQFSAKQCSVDSAKPVRLLRLKSVVERVGLSRSSIYNRIREGAFPMPVSLGGSSVGFVDQEVDSWIDAAIARRAERTKP